MPGLRRFLRAASATLGDIGKELPLWTEALRQATGSERPRCPSSRFKEPQFLCEP